MSEEKDEPAAPMPIAGDAPAETDQAAFDEFAQMAAKTAIWPIGALSAFAISSGTKRKS
jgi:hypothetical protein